jgi:hypothetical protein
VLAALLNEKTNSVIGLPLQLGTISTFCFIDLFFFITKNSCCVCYMWEFATIKFVITKFVITKFVITKFVITKFVIT